MNKQFHVVRITDQGYSRLSSHPERAAAKGALFAAGLRVGPVVLRDGVTGKRFSWAELSAEAAA